MDIICLKSISKKKGRSLTERDALDKAIEVQYGENQETKDHRDETLKDDFVFCILFDLMSWVMWRLAVLVSSDQRRIQ